MYEPPRPPKSSDGCFLEADWAGSFALEGRRADHCARQITARVDHCARQITTLGNAQASQAVITQKLYVETSSAVFNQLLQCKSLRAQATSEASPSFRHRGFLIFHLIPMFLAPYMVIKLTRTVQNQKANITIDSAV